MWCRTHYAIKARAATLEMTRGPGIPTMHRSEVSVAETTTSIQKWAACGARAPNFQESASALSPCDLSNNVPQLQKLVQINWLFEKVRTFKLHHALPFLRRRR